MVSYRKYRFAILGTAALCLAISSPALTLGRARGAVLLGQPLKLTVLIQTDPQDDPYSQCFEADVFYGDSKQDASRVTVSSNVTAGSQSGTVVVNASARVDEPVVTVYLRAGCEHKTTRSFVLLADLASEGQPAPAGGREQAPAQSPITLPAATAPGTGAVDRLAVAKPAKPVKAVKRSTKVQPSEPVAATTVAILLAKPVAPRRAHLKLAPLDLTIERDPTLKLSSELVLGEGEDLQKRAEAVALWRSLNASPQDILNADKRRLSIETDLKGLQAVTAKNNQTLQDLTARLGKAESERYLNPLVYGLLAFLLACCAGVAFAWWRMRQAGQNMTPWWRDGGVSVKSEWADAVHTVPPSLPTQIPVEELSESVFEVAPALTEVDIDVHLGKPHTPAAVVAAQVAQRRSVPVPNVAVARAAGHVDFSNSMNASLKALNTREMLDVRQQAEFFMTLGQHEDAIGMLKDSIDGSPDSNPLVYLDLLRLLHTLGRKTEFDQYRDDFNALFTGRVPAYTEFNQSQAGLAQAYPDVCKEISARWPTQEAVDYIEQHLVRAPGDDPSHGFDLEAFRDLLMLHGMARRIISSLDTGFQPFSAVRGAAVETSPSPSAYLATGESTVVDLDLSEPPGNLIDFDADELVSYKPIAPHKLK